ncbi:MAG: hypothetical protein ABIP35_17430 [Ginsengibacter sp.]
MKLLRLSLSIFILAALYSCNSLKRDTNDIVKGTPTNADSVLFSAAHPAKVGTEKQEAKTEVPRLYWR